MTDGHNTPADRLVRAFERPAHVIAAVLRLILAAGIVIALILKVYMIVLTDLTCEEDLSSLGNTIRCTPMLALLGYGFAASALIEFALRLLTHARRPFIAPFTQGVLAFLTLFLAGVVPATANWQQALVLTAATLLIAVVLLVRSGILNRHGDG